MASQRKLIINAIREVIGVETNCSEIKLSLQARLEILEILEEMFEKKQFIFKNVDKYNSITERRRYFLNNIKSVFNDLYNKSKGLNQTDCLTRKPKKVLTDLSSVDQELLDILGL